MGTGQECTSSRAERIEVHGSLARETQQPAQGAHLGARRVLQAGQAQEGEVALDGGVLGRVCQALVPAVRLAAVVVGQVGQVGLDGKGQQAQRAASQLVKQPAGGAGEGGAWTFKGVSAQETNPS